MTAKLPAVDAVSYQLPSLVRARLADNLADPATVEGSAVSASIAAAAQTINGANLGRTLSALRAGKNQTWAVIGDSKTDPTTPGNAAGGPIEKAAALVQARFGVTITIVNVAKSGHTAARQFIEGYVSTAVAAAPDLTFINLGTNDSNTDENGPYAAGYDVSASIAAIERATAYMRDANPLGEFVYIGTSPYNPLSSTSNAKIQTYIARLVQLAAVVGAEFVDLYAAFAAAPNLAALMYDSTHPGTLGNDLSAQTILAHFPLKSQGTTPALAARSVKGLTGIDKVAKTTGNLGYGQVSAAGTNNGVTMALTGTGWTINGIFDESSTAGDAVTISATATELLANIDLGATGTFDFYLDNVLVSANVNLHTQSSKNTTNYWLAPFTGLTAGAHAMKIVVKTGTLRIAAGAAVLASSGTGTFTPEVRFVDFGSSAASEAVDPTGAFTTHLTGALQLPAGWGAMLVQFVGFMQLRTLATTTTTREYQTQLLLGSTSLYQPQTTHPATTVANYSSARMDSVVEITATNSQGVYLRTRMLSTDKDKCTITGWSLRAVITRTA